MKRVYLTKRELRDKILGIVYGTAVGDALGYPVEFFDMEQINEKYPEGITDYPRLVKNGDKMIAQYSDDTQMLIATFQGLLRANTWDDLDHAAKCIAAEYVRWSQSPENNRAPGAACMYGCKNLDDGVPWKKAGKPDSKGCGTAMRAMAYGVWHWNDPEKAALWAAQHSLMTHNSKSAMAAAAGVAAAVATGIQGYSYGEMFQAAWEASSRYDEECSNMLSSAFIQYSDKTATEVLDHFRGWRGDESLAASMWCFARHSRSYQNAVLCAIQSPGDSDSLGAITGALAGSRLGIKSIPEHFVANIEASQALRDLSEELKKVIWKGVY